jgi:hypothetical protein
MTTREGQIPIERGSGSAGTSTSRPGPCCDLLHDLVLPTLLFVALGGMTWAVRGSSGFGAWKGCVFAGVTWGAAWWYLAHDPRKQQSRRYASAWIVVALTFGVGIAGIQGWMQWPSLFEGKLMTDATPGVDRFVPISRAYGYLWLFLAGAKWAGLGACLLAWCGSLRETRIWHWVARFLITHYPQHFVPLYDSMQAQYEDLRANPNLRRMMNDCNEAVHHLGFCLGFLVYEIFRRDWKNAVLILTVGIVNGAGWALCQNWKWAPHVFPGVHFNFWRCWESSGGLSMGLAFGLAYFLVNRRMSDRERTFVASQRALAGPNFEWLLVFLGLTGFLSIIFRLEVPWRLSLPEWLAASIHRDYLEWSAVFFAIVYVLGALYYFGNRGTPVDASPQRRRSGASIEWVGLLLTVALMTGLFIPIGTYAAWSQSLRIDRAIAHLSQLMLDLTSFLGPNHATRARGRSEYAAVEVMRLYLAAVMLVGIGWYFIRRREFDAEKQATTPVDGDPNVERMGLYLGLLAGLGLSLQYGLKGWFNTYRYDERVWDRRLQHLLAPIYAILLLAIAGWILLRPLPRNDRGSIFPHAAGAIWLVLLVQNAIAQAITGPLTNWQELAFNIYYALLFVVTAVTIVHFQRRKQLEASISRP